MPDSYQDRLDLFGWHYLQSIIFASDIMKFTMNTARNDEAFINSSYLFFCRLGRHVRQ